MSTKKNLLPSMKRVKQILSTAAFNPRLQGPLSAMVSIADRNYLEKRAMEFISEAEACRYVKKNTSPDALNWEEEEYVKNLRRAIQCLVLAIIKEE